MIYESEKWVPKDARQKRQFRVSVSDIKLYLDILKAVGSTSVLPQELTLKPKDNIKGEFQSDFGTGNPPKSGPSYEVRQIQRFAWNKESLMRTVENSNFYGLRF